MGLGVGEKWAPRKPGQTLQDPSVPEWNSAEPRTSTFKPGSQAVSTISVLETYLTFYNKTATRNHSTQVWRTMNFYKTKTWNHPRNSALPQSCPPPKVSTILTCRIIISFVGFITQAFITRYSIFFNLINLLIYNLVFPSFYSFPLQCICSTFWLIEHGVSHSLNVGDWIFMVHFNTFLCPLHFLQIGSWIQILY